jgi:hypothetical protein
MQRLCGQYSRYLRSAGLVEGNRVFSARYESKVIAPEYLPHAVRRTHRSPIVSGLCKQRVDYSFSSDRAYSGESTILPLDMTDVKLALEEKGFFGSRGYRDFMDQHETRYVANLLSHGSPLDSRVVGDRVFIQRSHHMVAQPALQRVPEKLIVAVARLLSKTPADIYSRTHVGVLGRSLVAWYSVRSGNATLTEVGRWFSVSAAALGQGIRHYRSASPELFNLDHPPGSARGRALE